MNTYLMMALWAVMLTVGVTSCEDNDAVEARTLDGSWTGYIDTYFQDRWGWTGNSYRTTMYFHQRDRYGGTGYEVDYNINNPYASHYYSDFIWEVNNGEIRIRYADSWDDVYIYDYRLTRRVFEGYMDDGTLRGIQFQLYYDDSFNWSPYRTYYAPTRSGSDFGQYYACGEFATASDAKSALETGGDGL